MPASEKTAYNMKVMHRVFAVSSLVLLAVTLWMIFSDHERPWKRHQRDHQHAERTRLKWEMLAAAGTTDFDPQRQQQLATELEQMNPTWFSGQFPWLGAKWLDLPVLDAFNSPVRIDQVWLPNLPQDYHHRQVERFDRCITCHVSTDRSQPGSPSEPLFTTRRTITLSLPTPVAPPVAIPATTVSDDNSDGDAAEADSEAADSDAAAADTDTSETQTPPAAADDDVARDILSEAYGFSLADHGLLPGDGVSVRQVLPDSLASAAPVIVPSDASVGDPASPKNEAEVLTGLDVRQRVAAGTMFSDTPTRQGLRVGDILVAIDDSPVAAAADVTRLLIDEADWGQPVTLTVKRGLPQPLASHPRLDLFVGSLSPHPLQEFGCSICHAGQGSATDFDWSSHTPNDLTSQQRWQEQFGWHPNPHWETPMLPHRFVESSCVKCHHDLVDLAASDRFPDVPAPKLLAGFNLVKQYGCYGCHELSGYDVAGRKIGPDLRLEPNDHAVALAVRADAGFQDLDARQREDIARLSAGRAAAELRGRVRQLLLDDARADQPGLSAASHKLADALRDPGVPGTLRKVGPSLRHVAQKLDVATLRRWIRNPRAFRADARMPQFFDLWSHLDGEGLEVSERLEPVEILGIATYLTARSQPNDLLTPPDREDEDAKTAAVRRGRAAFAMSGCVACHRHSDFPDATSTHGPELSRLADTLHPQDQRQWLYNWLRDPQRHHARTTMPNMRLDLQPHEDGTVTDTAADIADYLLTATATNADESAKDVETLVEPLAGDVDELIRRNLQSAFPEEPPAEIERYLDEGIPAEKVSKLNGPEEEYVAPLTPDKRLNYVGRKAISVRGCFGCHDIPLFEAAKPVGPALADWGRKKESLLDCGKVKEYLEAQQGETSEPAAVPGEGAAEATEESDAAGKADEQPATTPDKPGDALQDSPSPETLDPYYVHAVERQSRIGFLAQKLREPRSFDYQVAAQKKYYSRLQMPQFPFDERQREQVMTFVLGLVAQPPPPDFVHQIDEHERALLDGQALLEKYNCASCHVLRPQQWELVFQSGQIPAQPDKPTFPFVLPSPTPQELADSKNTDDQGRLHATVHGMPNAFDVDGLPLVLDDYEDPLEDDEDYEPETLFYLFDLWQNAVVDGQSFRPGVVPLMLTTPMIRSQRPAEGGEVIGLLSVRALERVREINPAAKRSEVRAWLPPPLIGQGQKVQSQWLHDYLLDPTPIRPAVLMKMPRFPLSAAEAERLTEYFALRDRAKHPYPAAAERREAYVASVRDQYEKKLAELPEDGEAPLAGDHFGDAMRIVVDENYCVKCHLIGDFSPGGDPSVLAPNLAKVHARLRPELLRRWIADPTGVLPYTTMPALIPYAAEDPHQGGLPQNLYHGTSREQLDALVDLLMNFDRYSLDRARITPLVEAAKTAVPTESDPETDDP